jgi:N-acetyl sugar amidotransferase
MDTSDPEIVFDEQGVCNHCTRANRLLEERLPKYKTGELRLDRVVDAIKATGRGHKFDCILGVSGGVDSTYAAYTASKLGLRVLAVHFDNGWNSELAVKNIESTLRRMGIDLFTYVVDWEEFRDLQLSFLKASVPDAEIPTDHGIWALLYKMAAKFGVSYVLTGTNLSTESILPRSWTYGITDWTYISGVQRRFGSHKLKSFPHCSMPAFAYYVLGRRIKTLSLLNCVEYDKGRAVTELEREIEYRNYGGKHHESIYTRFFQSYILPVKFGIDKRKAHLSSLVVSGQMTRAQAVAVLREPIADPRMIADDKVYVVKKLGLTGEAFDALMAQPPRSFRDYPNESHRFETLKKIVHVGQRLGILPAQVGL